MAILKCKMCGGDLEVNEGQSFATCDSCGSTMTLPKVNDERIVNLFNRANHYRRQNEFDKALASYESILEEDTKNAEAHWGCVLSRFGIEYVEDAKTHERIPTCHRVQNESILADLSYKSALEYAPDTYSKDLYQKEAERIAEIQKGILSVARNEEPYDIFICYKESDESGQRTKDSALAQDIYFQLTNEGYKVFFARITLEDRLGCEYEPYIFAALNSAKVMLVVGTKSEYFNAIWVKNEWARFLEITKKDKRKLIIPCYRDMDAYDLPEELSMFQSQDMSKIGFVQDLLRGIGKIMNTKQETASATVIQQTRDYDAETEALLKRAFLFLEDNKFSEANEALEKVLNLDPENAKAYLGKLMVDTETGKEENLSKIPILLNENSYFQKAVRFGDEELKNKLNEYASSAKQKFEELQAENARKEQERKEYFERLKEKKKEVQKRRVLLTLLTTASVFVCFVCLSFFLLGYGIGLLLMFVGLVPVVCVTFKKAWDYNTIFVRIIVEITQLKKELGDN